MVERHFTEKITEFALPIFVTKAFKKMKMFFFEKKTLFLHHIF